MVRKVSDGLVKWEKEGYEPDIILVHNNGEDGWWILSDGKVRVKEYIKEQNGWTLSEKEHIDRMTKYLLPTEFYR